MPIVTSRIIESTHEIEFRIQNFVKKTMNITNIGSIGTLGIYDSNTKTIKVNNLSNADHVEIAITTKNLTIRQTYFSVNYRRMFSDGTIKRKYKATFMIKTNKPIVTIAHKKPTTTTTNDGEVNFTIIW